MLANWPTRGGLPTILFHLPKQAAASDRHSDTTAGPSRDPESQRGEGSSQHSKRAATDKSRRSRKRAPSGGSNSNNSNSDEEPRAPSSKAKRRRSEAEGPRLHFACPFAKRDPVRWRTCYRHELSKISYVKQHLYRVHLQPLYCSRCGTTWYDIPGAAAAAADALAAHMRSPTPCQVRTFPTPEGLTAAQRARLGVRLSSKLSDEERWYAVFDIVFPGQPRPATPYVDPDMSEDLASFREHLTRQGPAILVGEYRRRRRRMGGGSGSGSGSTTPPPAALEGAMRRGLELISQSWLSLRAGASTAGGGGGGGQQQQQQQQEEEQEGEEKEGKGEEEQEQGEKEQGEEEQGKVQHLEVEQSSPRSSRRPRASESLRQADIEEEEEEEEELSEEE